MRPGDEHGGFVKIVDRAMVDGEAALDHGDGVQRERGQQQEIIHVVVLAKTLSPQENRIHRAQAVNHHGEQKEMTVSEPSHADRLIQENRPASGNSDLEFNAEMQRRGEYGLSSD